MPNGIDKNWYRMCASIDGFRARYGSWPTKIHLTKGTIEYLFTEETFARLEERLTFIYDGSLFIAEDDVGRSYNYGKEGSFDPPDVRAREWLEVEPDSEMVKEYYAPRSSNTEEDRVNSKPLPGCWSIGLPLFFGGLVGLPGLLLILTGLNIVVDVYPELVNGPRWVISVAGLPFFSWGVWIASHAFEGVAGENPAMAQFAKHFLILANLIPMAGIFLWGGFGPGERIFQVETTSGSYSVTSVANEIVGRIVFGGAGTFMAVLALLYIHTQFIRKKKR